jgi:hypothetical protein
VLVSEHLDCALWGSSAWVWPGSFTSRPPLGRRAAVARGHLVSQSVVQVLKKAFVNVVWPLWLLSTRTRQSTLWAVLNLGGARLCQATGSEGVMGSAQPERNRPGAWFSSHPATLSSRWTSLQLGSPP